MLKDDVNVNISIIFVAATTPLCSLHSYQSVHQKIQIDLKGIHIVLAVEKNCLLFKFL